MLNLRNVDAVPFLFAQKVKEHWWKYVIPQYFPAYKPTEIEEWPADVILEHLAAINLLKPKGGEGNG